MVTKAEKRALVRKALGLPDPRPPAATSPTHPAGAPSAAGPSLPAFWSASSCVSRLSICPIICCTRFVSLLLALDSST